MRKFIHASVMILVLVMATVLLSSNSSCEDEVRLKNAENAQAEKAKNEIYNEVMFCKGRMVLSNSIDHNVTLYVVKYDDCEYLVCTSYTKDSRGGTSVTIEHSASCRNEIHKNYE